MHISYNDNSIRIKGFIEFFFPFRWLIIFYTSRLNVTVNPIYSPNKQSIANAFKVRMCKDIRFSFCLFFSINEDLLSSSAHIYGYWLYSIFRSNKILTFHRIIMLLLLASARGYKCISLPKAINLNALIIIIISMIKWNIFNFYWNTMRWEVNWNAKKHGLTTI